MVITARLFRAVCYHPDIYQIITSGTDRKVCVCGGVLFTCLHAPRRAAASFCLLRGEDVLRLFNAALSERARERGRERFMEV